MFVERVNPVCLKNKSLYKFIELLQEAIQKKRAAPGGGGRKNTMLRYVYGKN